MASERICSLEGCDKPARTRELCTMHYQRLRKRGSTDAPPPSINSGKCKIDGCQKPAEKRGWCGAHWARWHRHGDPLGGGTPDGEPKKWLEVVLMSEADECLLWPFGTTGNGYPKLGGGKETRLVHRLICEETNGAPPTLKHEAAHNCGVALCCNPKHLRWATRKENLSDKIQHGTHNRGDRNNFAKLAENDVRAILAMKGSRSQRLIAKEYGVTQSCVSAIHTGKSWAWLSP